MALSVETSELIELFLWKTKGDIDKKRIAEELDDILIYTLLLVEKHGLDVNKIISSKLKLNEKKYPVEKSWGILKNIIRYKNYDYIPKHFRTIYSRCKIK